MHDMQSHPGPHFRNLNSDDELSTAPDDQIRAPVTRALVESGTPPPAWRVHGALILTQMIFGGGAVVGKLGVAHFNPVLFAMIREACAGPLLLAIARLTEGPALPRKEHFWWFVFAGFCLFANQLCFIVGEKLSSAVIGSAWQPSQPLFLAAISISLRWERATPLKLLGIAVAFFGAAFMVLTSATSLGSLAVGAAGSAVGNVLFFFNCLGTALYVLASRRLLQSYPATTVTGWCYSAASVQMVAVASFVTAQVGC